MYLVSFRASTGKNKKKYVKTQKYAQWRRRKGRFRQGRSVVAKGKVAARPGGLDTGIGSGKAGCFATKLLQAGSSCTRRGIGFRRAVLFLLQDRLLQGRPFCSGTGLRSQKKFLRSPVPAPPDGHKPQMLLPPLKEIPPEPRPCAHRTARMIPPSPRKGYSYEIIALTARKQS